MRVVLDTNILVRAGARSKGPAKELLRLIVNSPEHVLLISPFILMEPERICTYPRVRTATRLSDDEVMEYLGYLCSRHVSEAVFPGPAPAVVPSDADDDPVVHTAVVWARGCSLHLESPLLSSLGPRLLQPARGHNRRRCGDTPSRSPSATTAGVG